jgi:hypothetical protein
VYVVTRQTGSSQSRSRGQIEEFASGSLHVKVYAGLDPLTGKRLYLTAPCRRIANDLRGAIACGALKVGDHLQHRLRAPWLPLARECARAVCRGR